MHGEKESNNIFVRGSFATYHITPWALVTKNMVSEYGHAMYQVAIQKIFKFLTFFAKV